MNEMSITKREKLGGGIVALLSIIAVPLVQMWAEGRTKRATTAELDWWIPMVQSLYETNGKQAGEIYELKRLLRECRN